MNFENTEKISMILREKSASMLALLPAVRYSAQQTSLECACVDELTKSAYETLRTSQNLSAYSRLCTGISSAPFCVANGANSFVCAAQHVCKCANIQLKITSKPLLVNANESAFYVCLGNLISNSLLYAADTANVNICIYKSGTCAIIKVHDTSKGIKPEVVHRVFSAFASFDVYDESALPPGLGLGLAIVKKYADVFGGKLITESRFGVGTTVTLVLPLYKENMKGEGQLHSEHMFSWNKHKSGEHVQNVNAAASTWQDIKNTIDVKDFLCDKYSTLYTQLCGVCTLPI